LLTKRTELAKLLGYSDWAAYITEDRWSPASQNAADFIEKIAVASAPGSKRDYQDLLTFKKRTDPNAAVINPWEWLYLEHGAKIDKYGFDSQSVRPYLEYSRVKQGILDLTSRMYAITYKPVTDAKVWHSDVQVYDVYDGQDRIGRIYFDMFRGPTNTSTMPPSTSPPASKVSASRNTCWCATSRNPWGVNRG